MNGWDFWGLSGEDRTLSDVRFAYLASLGEADAEVIDEVPNDIEHGLVVGYDD